MCQLLRKSRIRSNLESSRSKYSPDLNLIENAFAKLKAGLRRAAERSTEALWNRIARLLDTYTPRECANYFRAAGYDPT